MWLGFAGAISSNVKLSDHAARSIGSAIVVGGDLLVRPARLPFHIRCRNQASELVFNQLAASECALNVHTCSIEPSGHSASMNHSSPSRWTTLNNGFCPVIVICRSKKRLNPKRGNAKTPGAPEARLLAGQLPLIPRANRTTNGVTAR
jgi:hypothetical protein